MKLYTLKDSCISLLLCSLFRRVLQFTAASVGFNWLSNNFVWLVICHPPACWWLCFVDHQMTFVKFFFFKTFAFVGRIWTFSSCQTWNENIWNIQHLVLFNCLITVNKKGGVFFHYKSFSIIIYEALKKIAPTSAFQRFYNSAQTPRLRSFWQSFLERSTWSWTSHSPYFLVSPVLRH